MSETAGLPIDLRTIITIVGVVVPICIWFSRYLSKTHKKIHKRLDIIEQQVIKIHNRLDDLEEELVGEEVVKRRVRRVYKP